MAPVQVAPSNTLLQALSSLTAPKRAQAIQSAAPTPRVEPPAKLGPQAQPPAGSGPQRMGRIIDIRV